jgi:hypothetical protein
VVNNKKKIETPSNPRTKLILEEESQARSVVNCSFVVELSKNTQNKIETKKVQKELVKPILFIKRVLSFGISIRTKIATNNVPNKREIIFYKFLIIKSKKSNKKNK